jgi:quaternary ammonium compound-resistance protein SugE
MNNEMSTGTAWIILITAGVFEAAWAIGLKYSFGFTKLIPSIITIICIIISMGLLALSLKALPVGSAYAVWTGIGAVSTAILGIYLFNESSELIRLFFILLIVIGIVGLYVFSGVLEN